ncbi:MAG: hypothetical protein RLN85_04645, partial [Pseudomonadales bacterium]
SWQLPSSAQQSDKLQAISGCSSQLQFTSTNEHNMSSPTWLADFILNGKRRKGNRTALASSRWIVRIINSPEVDFFPTRTVCFSCEDKPPLHPIPFPI